MAVQDAGPAPAEKSSLIYDPKVRGIFYQVVLITLIIWVGYEIVTNAARNLASQGIAGGFGFLETTAGFSIVQAMVEYSEESNYGRALVVGILNTLLVAVLGIFFATILGFIVGVARLSKNWVISQISYWFVEVGAQRAAAVANLLLVFRGAQGSAESARLRRGLAWHGLSEQSRILHAPADFR
jgi:general L-amino acid transport system permease protein